MWRHAILLLLTAASIPAAGQTLSLEQRAIAAGKDVSAHTLDQALPQQPFQAWFKRILPKTAKIEWESNDCGEQTGDPATTPPDPPVCSQVTATLSRRRVVIVMIAVGTLQKGVSGTPSVFFVVVEHGEASTLLKSLHELPAHI